MAISYVGGKVAGTAGQGGGSISLTTGLTGGSGGAPIAGDLVVVTVSVGTAARAPTLAISTPTGYTALTAQRTTATTYDTNVQTCYKVMTSTPDTAVTIPASGNNADGIAYAIQVFRGVDTATPMDATATYATGTATNNLPNGAAITPVTAGAWIVVCGGGAAAAGGTYAAAGLTNFLTANGPDTNDGNVGAGYYTGWTSGAYDPAAFTGGSADAANSWGCTTIALRPAPEAVDGTATPSGTSGSAAVGSLTAIGSAATTVSGIAASSGVGSITGAGGAAATVSGVSATSAVGTVLADAVMPVDATVEIVGATNPTYWDVDFTWDASTWDGQAPAGLAGSATAVGTADVAVTLTGVSATAGVGFPTITGDASTTLTGASGSASVGSVVAGGGGAATLTGVSGESAVGTVAGRGDASGTISGASGTAATGTATGRGTANLTLVSASGAGTSGTAAGRGAGNTSVSGVSAVAGAGTTSAKGNATVTLVGVASSAGVGSVAGSGAGNAALIGAAASTATGSITSTGTANVAMTGAQANAYAGTIVADGGEVVVVLADYITIWRRRRA